MKAFYESGISYIRLILANKWSCIFTTYIREFCILLQVVEIVQEEEPAHLIERSQKMRYDAPPV